VYKDNPIPYAKHYIECTDYHYAADKRLVAKAYESEDIQVIVTDLFNTYLLDEDLTIGQIDSDFTISQVSFNYVPLDEALDDLADRTGYFWKVDQDKKFYFVKRTAMVYPNTLTESDILDSSIKLISNNNKYRNRQVIKNVKDITSPQTEIFKGDGEKITFTVGYSLAKVPTVETSTDGSIYNLKTVGIRGLDTGKDFYWSKGEKEITQDSAGTPLTSTEYLRITYQGQIDLIIVSQDNTKVSDRQALEQGGTGLVENAYSERAETADSAFQLAGKLIEKFGNPSVTLTFDTLQSGFKAGQIVDVDLLNYKYNGEMLIEEVNIFYTGNNRRYSVKATQGTERKSWTSYFNSLYKQAKQREIDTQIVSEVITVPYNFEKAWIISEQPNIYTETYPTGQSPSSSLYPSFEDTDKNKILEVYNSGGVIGRKAVAQVSGNLTAIALLAPADFAGEAITKFAWYSGIDATLTLGTGFKIDEKSQTVDLVSSPWSKTSIETWQIQHTSIKGWS
jgi:hypothetical protein